MDHSRVVSSESEFLEWLTVALDEERHRLRAQHAEISLIVDGFPESRDTTMQAQRTEELHPLVHFRSWQSRLQSANPKSAVTHGRKERP